MAEKDSITDLDLEGLIGNALSDPLDKIKALGLSIIGVARADLDDLPNVHDVWHHIEELAAMITKEVDRTWENLGNLDLEVPKAENQTSSQDHLEEIQ